VGFGRIAESKGLPLMRMRDDGGRLLNLLFSYFYDPFKLLDEDPLSSGPVCLLRAREPLVRCPYVLSFTFEGVKGDFQGR